MTLTTVADIAGVRLTPLPASSTGSVRETELWRAGEGAGITPLQWNVVRSRAGVLRGVHVHARHGDHLMLARGRAVIGLHDLRPDSATHGASLTVELRPHTHAITIPPGVAHGFCFTEPSIHVYAVSHYFDPADEFGCRYDDPGLAIEWPVETPLISERDAALPALDELVVNLRRAVATR